MSGWKSEVEERFAHLEARLAAAESRASISPYHRRKETQSERDTERVSVSWHLASVSPEFGDLAYLDTDPALASHVANTSNPHSVTATQVGLGNVENTALSTWAGSTNLTTLGTIATGVWNGTAVPVLYGGTGLTTYGGAGRLIYSSSASALAALAPGSDSHVLTLSGGLPTWAASASPAPAYGGMSLTGGSTATTITTGGTFYKFDQFDTSTSASNVTPDPTTDNDLTVDTGYGGKYLIGFSCSCSSTSGTLVTIAVFVSGTISTVTAKFYNGSGTVVNLAAQSIVTLAQGDTVDLRVTTTNDSETVTPVEMYLWIKRAGT